MILNLSAVPAQFIAFMRLHRLAIFFSSKSGRGVLLLPVSTIPWLTWALGVHSKTSHPHWRPSFGDTSLSLPTSSLPRGARRLRPMIGTARSSTWRLTPTIRILRAFLLLLDVLGHVTALRASSGLRAPRVLHSSFDSGYRRLTGTSEVNDQCETTYSREQARVLRKTTKGKMDAKKKQQGDIHCTMDTIQICCFVTEALKTPASSTKSRSGEQDRDRPKDPSPPSRTTGCLDCCKHQRRH